MLVEHGDVLCYLGVPSFRLLCYLNAAAKSIAINAVEGGEKRLRFRVFVQFRLEILWNRDCPLRIVGDIPAAILFSGLNFLEARWLHSAFVDQVLHLLRIDLRPSAFRATFGEFLQKELIVQRPFLPVDPAVTQRNVERFCIGYRINTRSLFSDLEPDPRRCRMMLFEPRLPRL